MKKNERIRVNMRLPEDLVSWAKKHGDKTNTCLLYTSPSPRD